MISAPFEYRSPGSVQELLEILGKHGESARVLAGGQSLIPSLKLRGRVPRLVVDLRRVPGLRGIRVVGEGVWIGALETYREVQTSSLVRARCPLLAEVVSSVGDVQLRNIGTLTGAVCHADPGADGSAALVALEAKVEIVSPRGDKSVSVSDFLQGPMEPALEPDEIVRAVWIPDAGMHGHAYARQARSQAGFALVGVAARVFQSGGRITSATLGIVGVGRSAYRVPEVEEALEGLEIGAAEIREAVRGLARGREILQDVHASAGYRAHLAEILATRAIQAAARRASD